MYVVRYPWFSYPQALVKSCNICLDISKVLQNSKATISLGRVEVFCLFIASSYTSMETTVYYVVLLGYGLECWNFSETTNHQYLWKGLSHFVDCLQFIFLLFWAGIVRNSLSTNQIVRCIKLKKLKNNMRYQVDFLLKLKPEQISCYFALRPQNTLGQSVCSDFYFW